MYIMPDLGGSAVIDILDPGELVLQQVEQQHLHAECSRGTSKRRDERAYRLPLLVLRSTSASARVEEVRHGYLSSLMEEG